MPEPTRVAFLGMAERANALHDGPTPLIKWNVIGLKQTLLTFILPVSLGGIPWAFALRLGSDTALRLRVKSETGEQVGEINIGLEASVAIPEGVAGVSIGPESPPPPAGVRLFVIDPQAWMVFLFEVNSPSPIFIFQPGRYTIFKIEDDGVASHVTHKLKPLQVWIRSRK
jgi:hypothetical protein